MAVLAGDKCDGRGVATKERDTVAGWCRRGGPGTGLLPATASYTNWLWSHRITMVETGCGTDCSAGGRDDCRSFRATAPRAATATPRSPAQPGGASAVFSVRPATLRRHEGRVNVRRRGPCAGQRSRV